MTKNYLGDSVYVDFDSFALTLATENGKPDDPSNIIIMEPSVYRAITCYVERIRQQYPDAMK